MRSSNAIYVMIVTSRCVSVEDLIVGVDDPLKGEKMRIVLSAEETRQRCAIRDLVQANTEAQDYFVARKCASSLTGSADGAVS